MNDIEQSIVAIAKYVKDETTKIKLQVSAQETGGPWIEKTSVLEKKVDDIQNKISGIMSSSTPPHETSNKGKTLILENKISDLQNQISSIKDTLSGVHIDKEGVEKQMKEMHFKQSPKITALEQQLEELQKHHAAPSVLASDIENIKSKMVTKSELESLKSSMTAKAEIDNVKSSFSKYDGLFERVNSTERKIAEFSYIKRMLDEMKNNFNEIKTATTGAPSDIVEIDKLVLDKYRNNIDKKISEMEQEFQNRIDGLKMVLEEEAKNILAGASKTEIETMKQEGEKIRLDMQGMSKKLMILEDEEGVDISSVDKRVQDLKKSLSDMQSEITKMKNEDYDNISLRREVEAIKERVKSPDEHIKTIATKHMMKQFEDFTHYLDKKMPDIVTLDEFQKYMNSINSRLQSIEASGMRNLSAKVDVLERSINIMITQLNNVHLSMPKIVE